MWNYYVLRSGGLRFNFWGGKIRFEEKHNIEERGRRRIDRMNRMKAKCQRERQWREKAYIWKCKKGVWKLNLKFPSQNLFLKKIMGSRISWKFPIKYSKEPIFEFSQNNFFYENIILLLWISNIRYPK